MIKNSIVFRKCGSDAWWETNCVLRCWVRSRTERTSIHGNTARTPIFSGKAWHWLNLMQKNWIRKNTRKYGFNFDKGLIDQMMFTSTSDQFSHIEVLVKSFTKKKIQKFQEILLYFDKGLTHFKLHYVLYMYPLIDKINFLLILRCHGMLMYSFRFRAIKQQWSFVMSELYFSCLDKKDLNAHLSVFCLPENSVSFWRTLSYQLLYCGII